MKSKIKFRKYSSKDYLQIKKNLIEANLHFDGKKQIERMVKRDPESIVIAVDGNKIVGGAYFIDMGCIAMMFRLYVIPEYRKQGLGKIIIDEVKKRAKKRGITELHFVVKEKYDKLKDWYERVGAKKGNVHRWMWFKF